MKFSLTNVSRGLALVSALALIYVFAAQYLNGYAPCHLCIIQRWWHGVVMALGIATLFIAKPRLLLQLQTAALVICFAYAIFHVGVEQHWWGGTSACASIPKPQSIEDLTAQILATSVARCDEPTWFLFGLSMAIYNAVLTFVMALAGTVVLARKSKAAS